MKFEIIWTGLGAILVNRLNNRNLLLAVKKKLSMVYYNQYHEYYIIKKLKQYTFFILLKGLRHDLSLKF